MSEYEMEYIDFVDRGCELLQRRDADAWQLGDLVIDFEITVGRPKDGEDAPTLSDLANSWDVSKSRMSEWRNTSKFYPTNVRTFSVSWSHYNLARRSADGELDNALELLSNAEKLHMGIREFQRYLKGIFYEGEWQGNGTDIPGWLRIFVPRDAKLWITVQRYKDDE